MGFVQTLVIVYICVVMSYGLVNALCIDFALFNVFFKSTLLSCLRLLLFIPKKKSSPKNDI